MLKGTTASGFEYCIADEALDDYELLESLNGLTKGNVAEITDVVDMLLGEEAKAELKAHLRGKNGRVKASDMMAEVLEIIKGSKEGKKS